MPTYHVCVIIRNYNKNVVNKFLTNLSKLAKIISYAVDNKPVKHIHLLVKAKYRLKYVVLLSKGIYVRIKPVKTLGYYYNVVKYIHAHKISGGDKDMENSELLNKIMERLEKIEKDIEELKVTRNVSTARQLEINLSRMTIRLQPARKGLAMRIKFARYIKRNQRGEYYVILSKEDLRNLIVALQSIKYPEQNNQYRNNRRNSNRNVENISNALS